MDDIIQWHTNGKDYKTGVAVLDRHIRNKALIRHFQFSTPKCAAAKLEYELRKLLNGATVSFVYDTPTAQVYTGVMESLIGQSTNLDDETVTP